MLVPNGLHSNLSFYSEEVLLSRGQLRQDALYHSFIEQMTDQPTFALMAAASSVGCFARVLGTQAAMSLGFGRSAQVAGYALGLFGEVETFRALERLRNDQAIFKENAAALTGTLLDFAILQGGCLFSTSNPLISHLVRTHVMTLTHGVVAQLGLAEEAEQGSYLDRWIHASVTEFSMGVGMRTSHQFTGGAFYLLQNNLTQKSERINLEKRDIIFQRDRGPSSNHLFTEREGRGGRAEHPLSMTGQDGRVHSYSVMTEPLKNLQTVGNIILIGLREGRRIQGTVTQVLPESNHLSATNVKLEIREEGFQGIGEAHLILRGGTNPVFEVFSIDTLRGSLPAGSGRIFLNWAAAQAASQGYMFRIARIVNPKIIKMVLRSRLYDPSRAATLSGVMKDPVSGFTLALSHLREEHVDRLYGLGRLIPPDIECYPNPDLFRFPAL